MVKSLNFAYENAGVLNDTNTLIGIENVKLSDGIIPLTGNASTIDTEQLDCAFAVDDVFEGSRGYIDPMDQLEGLDPNVDISAIGTFENNPFVGTSTGAQGEENVVNLKNMLANNLDLEKDGESFDELNGEDIFQKLHSSVFESDDVVGGFKAHEHTTLNTVLDGHTFTGNTRKKHIGTGEVALKKINTITERIYSTGTDLTEVEKGSLQTKVAFTVLTDEDETKTILSQTIDEQVDLEISVGNTDTVGIDANGKFKGTNNAIQGVKFDWDGTACITENRTFSGKSLNIPNNLPFRVCAEVTIRGKMSVKPGARVEIAPGGSIVVESGASVIIEKGATVITYAKEGDKNEGTITNNGTIDNNGIITNDGTIYSVDDINGTVNGNRPIMFVSENGALISANAIADPDSDFPVERDGDGDCNIQQVSTGGQQVSTGGQQVSTGGIITEYDLSGIDIAVGSKDFAEQLILGEMLVQAFEAAGASVDNKVNLGGTNVARAALEGGEIDIYPEYNGTGWTVHLGMENPSFDPEELTSGVREKDLEINGIVWVGCSPFSNTYGFASSPEVTEANMGAFSLQTMMEYVDANPDAIVCMESEFPSRDDGLILTETATGIELHDKQQLLLDSGIIYTELANNNANKNSCDFGQVFTTDGRIPALGLTLVEDPGVYPAFNVSGTMRNEKYNEARDVFDEIIELVLAPLDNERMAALNAKVSADSEDPADVARDYLVAEGLID